MKKIFLTAFFIIIETCSIYSQTGNTFTAAFDSLHKKLPVYYAFTDWKKINWDKLYSEFKPRFATAQAQNDSSAFIMAMKEYTHRIPDGHVSFSTGFYFGVVSSMVKEKKTPWVRLEKKLREKYIGGSYGFAIIKLDDGRFVVRLVTSGSPAELGGIKFGAEILEGHDSFAAAVAGCFYSDTTFYEYESYYDPVTESFQRAKSPLNHLSFQTLSFVKPTKYPLGSLFIEPQGVSFKAPVVVMVSPRNESSGEGIAMALQKLPQCKVVSFYGTNGSFGIQAEPFKLLSIADSLKVSYPDGRSLDAYNRIQLDSDSDMKGGVIPNIRPPLNDETIDKMYLQGIDYELEFALQELKKMNGIVGVQNHDNQILESYSLYQNYPNPFNPVTKIKYSIPINSQVTIKVYDILGKEVSTLVDKFTNAGKYEVEFNASNLASGIYFYQMLSVNTTNTKKLLFMK